MPAPDFRSEKHDLLLLRVHGRERTHGCSSREGACFMSPRVTGIHHITAIAGDAQRNLNFYVGTLGLRLVKLTVNFDDPFTYHLYYGDATGAPGTLLTFFPWRGVPPGRAGDGQVPRVAFAVPASSLSYWEDRLRSVDVAYERPEPRFGEEILSVSDPHGMGLGGGRSNRTGGAPPPSRRCAAS